MLGAQEAVGADGLVEQQVLPYWRLQSPYCYAGQLLYLAEGGPVLGAKWVAVVEGQGEPRSTLHQLYAFTSQHLGRSLAEVEPYLQMQVEEEVV